ncbi:MAG: hypothetical protein GX443_16510 [Deltaproteobacteria bacterium]|nr:hypothetical protein [Deltaproteobacteria bacterium]
MTRKSFTLILVFLFFIVGTPACSGEKDSAGRPSRTASEPNPTAAAIQEYSRNPLNKAKSTCNLGDVRLEASDRAVRDAGAK